jgi:hypothetical protein
MGDLINTKTVSIKKAVIKSKRIFSEDKKKKIKTRHSTKHKEIKIQIFCNLRTAIRLRLI